MKTVEPREERVGVADDVGVVLGEDLPQELVLRVADRLDDEAIVPRKVEKRSRLSR